MSRPERILVTGASRGIGRAIAERLLAQDRQVVLVGRDAARLAEIARSDRAHVLAADLAREDDIVQRAISILGGLDGLVHAAGVALHAPLPRIRDEELRDCVALHMRAPLRLMQELALHLRSERRAGSIVHIASTLAFRPAEGTLVYSATKAALVAMTRAAALELAADGIRVNCVAPGVIDTDMVRTLREDDERNAGSREERVREKLDALARLHPLGRLGTASEVADAVLYLLDAEWATGSVLTIDGGLTAG